MAYDVGIDIGSVSINCVVISEKGDIVLDMPYLRHFGLVHEETRKLLEKLADPTFFPGAGEIRSVSFTGVHGQLIAEILGAPYEVETISQVLGVLHVVPGARSIITMGGQDAALLQVAHEGGQWHFEAFNMNGPCASGTGSFIDQQAERLSQSLYGPDFHMDQSTLQQTLEGFIETGMKSTYPAPVACRCTVFTKSDMIHLQNKGEALPNIIAGLHFGNAANYMSTIVGNRELADPVVFIGGMASNALQVQAFRNYFSKLVVPPHHTSLGALGTALQSRKAGITTEAFDLTRLELNGGRPDKLFPRAERLQLQWTKFDADNSLSPWKADPDHPVDAFLGIDIGSTTTKYALIDEEGRILHKCYVPTQGKPIEVAQRLLRTLSKDVGRSVNLLAVATTGSGRNVVGDFVSADLVIDEITAHARGAIAVDPEIDTIFEIGGQDSKYIRIENTHPLDFDMNKVCAAGTGSFLHELANKMKINIVGEFQDVALSSEVPIALAERCTVFMESDLVSYAQKGAQRRDLIGGLCYAIVYNYLNRVVENRAVGQRVMFLGGPSLNQGIVAAFERVLKRPLLVPKHREVMGAYGAALSVRELYRKGGVEALSRDLESLAGMQVDFEEKVCHADKKCHNECKLKVYTFGGHKSVWGGDCGRYEIGRFEGTRHPNLFQERQQRFTEAIEATGAVILETTNNGATLGKPVIGIPYAIHTHEWGLFWASILTESGFSVVLSPKTNNRIVLAGVESMTAETCFPIKVFHGHVRVLLDEADYLFMPNAITMPTPEPHEMGYFCPLVSSSQYMARAALRIPDDRLIRPTLFLKDGVEDAVHEVFQSFPAKIRPSWSTVERAVKVAWERQKAFRLGLVERGREVLEGWTSAEPLWVVTGRPYNLHDERLNLQMGRQFVKLGIKAVPVDFLDLDSEDLSDFPKMYWGLGARIIRAAKRIARTPGWYGVHLTNFSCGADSFIEHFYRDTLKQKPSLILELDEHSAVAGVLTRIEAYKNVVKNLQEKLGVKDSAA